MIQYAHHLTSTPSSSFFSDDERTIGSHRVVDASVPIPLFGNTKSWNLAAAGIAPNLGPSSAIINFLRFKGQ